VEAPLIEATWKKYKDRGLQVLGINTWLAGQSVQNLRNVYINPTGTTYPVLMFGDTLVTKYGGSGVEDYFLIDLAGKVSYRIHNYNRFAMETKIDELLAVSGLLDQNKIKPVEFVLKQNYPNPFNPSTILEFSLRNTVRKTVTLKVYDLLGRHIFTLANASLPSGIHRFEWNGKDINGNQVSTGVYLYVLQVGDSRDVRRMVLVR
jgi:hypothetical protein